MDTATRDRWLEHASQRMTAAGLRAGAARTAVVETLAREGQCLLTAAEIADRLRGASAGSIATVYRVVDELSELGLLHRYDGRDGVARFEIADPDHHHHHVVDEATGAVEPFADDELERAIAGVAARLGYELTGHDVVLRGRRRGG
ncbi:transcriptional repressor [Patulibacter sp. SYSU D01012]|uniref:Fur family transcriptional regulator n=1 Tax=Patulibacter sp. SYSU D01012 TaxID=2817381 RepID=UPI001B31137A